MKCEIGGKFSVEYRCDEYKDIYSIYVEKVIYNDPATIVLWSDGTRTVSKCHPKDKYSRETGLALCYLKKLVGNNEVRRYMMHWLPETDTQTVVTLKDVRKRIKKEEQQ